MQLLCLGTNEFRTIGTVHTMQLILYKYGALTNCTILTVYHFHLIQDSKSSFSYTSNKGLLKTCNNKIRASETTQSVTKRCRNRVWWITSLIWRTIKVRQLCELIFLLWNIADNLILDLYLQQSHFLCNYFKYDKLLLPVNFVLNFYVI